MSRVNSSRAGHEVVLVARGRNQTDSAIHQLARTRFVPMNLDNVAELARAFAGCEAVVHGAGINREIDGQTYQRVHVDGSRNVIEAARRAGCRKIVVISFLRARPDCGSGYHESKWAAEELARQSGLDYTVLKCGVIYGQGDHMLNHLSHAFLHVSGICLCRFSPAADSAERGRRCGANRAGIPIRSAVVAEDGGGDGAGDVDSAASGATRGARGRAASDHVPDAGLVSSGAGPGSGTNDARSDGFDRTGANAGRRPAEPCGACDPMPADLAPKIVFSEEQICLGLPRRARLGGGIFGSAAPMAKRERITDTAHFLKFHEGETESCWTES